MDQKVLDEVFKIIAFHLGDSAVIMYKDFYKDKPDGIILKSITELLNELTGPKNAEKQLDKINKLIA